MAHKSTQMNAFVDSIRARVEGMDWVRRHLYIDHIALSMRVYTRGLFYRSLMKSMGPEMEGQ